MAIDFKAPVETGSIKSFGAPGLTGGSTFAGRSFETLVTKTEAEPQRPSLEDSAARLREQREADEAARKRREAEEARLAAKKEPALKPGEVRVGSASRIPPTAKIAKADDRDQRPSEPSEIDPDTGKVKVGKGPGVKDSGGRVAAASVDDVNGGKKPAKIALPGDLDDSQTPGLSGTGLPGGRTRVTQVDPVTGDEIPGSRNPRLADGRRTERPDGEPGDRPASTLLGEDGEPRGQRGRRSGRSPSPHGRDVARGDVAPMTLSGTPAHVPVRGEREVPPPLKVALASGVDAYVPGELEKEGNTIDPETGLSQRGLTSQQIAAAQFERDYKPMTRVGEVSGVLAVLTRQNRMG